MLRDTVSRSSCQHTHMHSVCTQVKRNETEWHRPGRWQHPMWGCMMQYFWPVTALKHIQDRCKRSSLIDHTTSNPTDVLQPPYLHLLQFFKATFWWEVQNFSISPFNALVRVTTHILQSWRFGVAVTRWSRSTQLLYIEPGYYWDGWLPSGR